MSTPSPQKSLDETMKSLRLASNRPAWMAKMPSQAATGAASARPTPGCPNPKKARLRWDGCADASDPVLQAPEGLLMLADAATEEQNQKPKQSASVLDELGLRQSASGQLPPGSPIPPASSGAPPGASNQGAPSKACRRRIGREYDSPSRSPPSPVIASGVLSSPPNNRKECRQSTAIDLSPDDSGTESPAILTKPSPVAPLSQVVPPGAAEPKAAEPKAAELEAAVPASAESQSQEPIQAAVASQDDTTKTPQEPEKYFDKVMLPKLEKGDSLDITAHLVAWAPARLKAIKKAMRRP